MGKWRHSTWGQEIALEYGKAIRGYSHTIGKYRVFGSNGPIGWTTEPLTSGPGVILGRKGAYRGVCFCREPFFVIDTAYYVVPKSGFDVRWLYYAIVYHKLGEIDDGSPIPSTTRAAVYVRELEVPPLQEQRAISSILGALDDKIDLNRRMNETLEATARAIFKDWFVDFGPTRAKTEGWTPYLSPDIWALFPSKLDDEGKPEGWEKHSIYEIADVIYGAPFASVQFNTEKQGDPLIRIRDLRNEQPGVWTPEVHPRGYKVKAGDIVVGMDGEFRAYLWGGEEAWLNQRVCVFAPKVGFSAAFVRNCIEGPLGEVESTEIATTVIHLGKNDIDRFSALLPAQSIVARFNELAQPLFDRIVANKQHARTLASTRDLLLSKLMSGEIRMREAEKIAEMAA